MMPVFDPGMPFGEAMFRSPENSGKGLEKI